jgi:hypothetical protein
MTGLLIAIGNYIGGIVTGTPVPPVFDYILNENGVDFIITEGGDDMITE